MDLLIVISGPATVGKSRLLRYIAKKYKDFQIGISHTTRTKRIGEIEGKDYYFVSEREFGELVKQEKLAFYKKNNIGDWYGISYDEIYKKNESIMLIDLDPDGMMYLKEKYGNVISVYLLPVSYDKIIYRLKNRYILNKKQSSFLYEQKLNHSIQNLFQSTKYDYVFINDNIITTAYLINLIRRLHMLSLTKEEVEKWLKEQIK